MDSRLSISIVETILAQLFVIDIIRNQLVSKNWGAIIRSPTFRSAFLEVEDRSPWFLVSSKDNTIYCVYDTETDEWLPRELSIPTGTCPITTSGSLMCLLSQQGTIGVWNPFTGAINPLPGCVITKEDHEAIAMLATKSSFEVFVVSRNVLGHSMKIFSSEKNSWREIQLAHHLVDDTADDDSLWSFSIGNEGLTTTDNEGNLIVYYIDGYCQLTKCDINSCIAYQYPYFEVPDYQLYVCALAECWGHIFIVVLTDDFQGDEYGDVHGESEAIDDVLGMTLQICEFNHGVQEWTVVSEFEFVMNGFSNAPKISCSGKGNFVMISVPKNDYGLHDVFKYNIVDDVWETLPSYIDSATGEAKKFGEVFSIVPDIGFLL